MTKERPLAPELMEAKPLSIRNPYIMNFCKVLVERKGERLEADQEKKLLDDMYRLFENMLGQNMVKALPEDLRRQYLAMADDLENLSYDKVGDVFDENVPQYEQIMKETMKQFADIYMKNRTFDPDNFKTAPDGGDEEA